MKKRTIFIAVMIIATLTACSYNRFDNTLPMKQVLVSVDYGNLVKDKATFTFSEDIDIGNKKMFNKANTSKKIKNLLPGDNVEIYYRDDNYDQIHHILVDAVEIVKVTNAGIPGSGDMDIFVESEKITIRHPDIFHIINSDSTFDNLQKADDFRELYATYKESDCLYNDVSERKIITINALYSYEPRIS